VVAHLHAVLGPCCGYQSQFVLNVSSAAIEEGIAHKHTIKVILRRHSAPNPLLRANAPVLRERLGPIDRRRIHARARVDLVLAAVGRHGALVGQLAGRVVGAVRVEDVVFDQRGAGPAVDAEVGVAVRLEGAGVFDGSD
jgi:hypothetical protein